MFYPYFLVQHESLIYLYEYCVILMFMICYRLQGKPICARIKLKPMIRLPSGPPASGAPAASGGSNTPTTNTAPSPVTQVVGSQSMQPVTSISQSTNVSAQSFSGSNGPSTIVSATNSAGSVSLSSQGPQQQGNNPAFGNSKNSLNRTAPSPAQGQQPSNAIQQASTGNDIS